MSVAIDIHHLSKAYAETLAIDGIDLSVPEGVIYGLIGPDGAGKTTLFRILATLITPDTGTALVRGLDVVRDYRHIRHLLGYMPGQFSLYQDLTVQENLRFFATLFGTTVEANYTLIRDIYTQLEPFRKRRAKHLSGGMKQKLALCCALVHKPEVLLLDEPTTGVDPVSRREFWDILAHLRAQGMTILAATPYMDEATRCDRIAFLRGGVVIAQSTPAQLVAEYTDTLLAVRGQPMGLLLRLLKETDGVHSVYSFGDQLHVTLDLVVLSLEGLRAIVEADPRINDVEVGLIEPTVEDCYLRLAHATPLSATNTSRQ